MIKFLFKNQFPQFLLAGGFAALVNFFSRIFYNQWMPFSVAIVVAYITGMAFAYLIMRMMIFTTAKNSVYKSIFFFVLINLLAIVQTWLVSMIIFIIVLPHFMVSTFTKEISHACGVIFPVFTSYFGHKYLSFK